MEIVRTATYARNLKRLGKLGATDADVIAMENAIAANPEVGAVIKGSGGMRKIGFGGSGKSARTIYAASLKTKSSTRPATPRRTRPPGRTEAV